MSTLLDIATDAFIELGVYGPGETVSPEDAALALRYANRLIANWNNERLTVYQRRIDLIPIIASDVTGFSIGAATLSAGAISNASSAVITIPNNAQIGQYVTLSGATGQWAAAMGTAQITAASSSAITIGLSTVGLGASPAGIVLQVSMPRPIAIESANMVEPTGHRHQLELLSSRQWAQKPSRLTVDIVAWQLYCDFQYPLANVYPWPAPSQLNCEIELFTWQQLSQFLSITQTFDLPPGYEAAIMFNLAVDLAGATKAPLSQTTAARAQQYKGIIQGINPPPYNGAMEEAVVSQPPAPPQPPQQQQAPPQR
jgi:hypothetical protein